MGPPGTAKAPTMVLADFVPPLDPQGRPVLLETRMASGNDATAQCMLARKTMYARMPMRSSLLLTSPARIATQTATEMFPSVAAPEASAPAVASC